MTAHNYQDDTNIASNTVFDELDDDAATIATKDTMDTVATSVDCSSRIVSLPEQDTHHQMMMAECTAAMPVVSPCPTNESDFPATPAMMITGRYTNIEDKYHVDSRVLGTGHHGSVRECIHRASGQRYAVKSISKSHPSVKPAALVREIMLLQEMKHHSIVQLVDVCEDAEYIHLVTDLCKGGELFDKIVERSSSDNGVPCFTEEEAAKVMYQILQAVSYMHKKGVAHRDIKPENILFEGTQDDSSIKIIDFGLARKHFGAYGEPPMSTIVGTPYYIAPDVLKKKYDKSCDLWSVGVIAYILLCGYPPFNGLNNDETHGAVLRGRYVFPSREWKHTSREARDFIRGLLQSDPGKRMTVEEALNHPWMARYSDVVMVQDRQPTMEDEAVVKGLRIPRKGSLLCSRVTGRKIRKSMFGI